MLWVAPVGDRRSYAILARNFLVENSTNKKLTKFREYRLKVVDTRRFEHSKISDTLENYFFAEKARQMGRSLDALIATQKPFYQRHELMF